MHHNLQSEINFSLLVEKNHQQHYNTIDRNMGYTIKELNNSII